MKRLLFLICLSFFIVLAVGQDGIPWVPQVQLFDAAGDPLAGGKVYTYIAGTTTNQATYTDSTLGTANANPVVLSAAGRANIWLDETLSYRIDVKTSADVTVYSVDNITSQFSTNLFTIGNGAATDVRLHFDGNAQDFHIGLDDSADDLVFGLGSALGTTTAFAIDENQVTTFSQDPIIAGTTPRITVGDAGAEDTQITYDGATNDYSLGLDDSANDVVLATGAALGTDNMVAFPNVGTGVSDQRMILYGANPATAADNDESYVSLMLEDDQPAQVEFARLSYQALDVTNTTKDGSLTFDVMVGNSLTEAFVIDSTGTAARIQVPGQALFNGAVTLGNAAADSITITGSVAANVALNNTVAILGNDAGGTGRELLYTTGNDQYFGGGVGSTGALYMRHRNTVFLFYDGTTTTVTGPLDLTGSVLGGGTPLVLEGATGNDFETSVLLTDPTADRQITLPNATGTVITTGNTSDLVTNETDNRVLTSLGANSGGNAEANLTFDGNTLTVTATPTNVRAFHINMPASTTYQAAQFSYNSIDYSYITTTSTTNSFDLSSVDLGNNVRGPAVHIGRNTNATNAGGGNVRFTDRGGTDYYVHADDAGLLRIGTTSPIGGSDTTNGVVGDQTSWFEAKNYRPTTTTPAAALESILNMDIFDFEYKSGAYGSQTFVGPVGLDRNDWFLKGLGQKEPSLNEITLHGYTLLAIKAMERQILDLQKELLAQEKER